MERLLSFPTLSLRVKLVLSYLAVTLGAIFVLAFAVSGAVQSYFYTIQINRLSELAQLNASQIETIYRRTGTLDSDSLAHLFESDPVLVVVADTTGTQVICSQPYYLSERNCTTPEVQRALTQTTQQGRTIDGNFTIFTQETDVSSLYVTVPLQYNGQTIGSLFVSTQEGRQPDPFLRQVNQAIVLSGIAISLIVVLFSFVLARRFTQPLEVLTIAAEGMKQGKYTQRVTLPKTQDELGRLAQTFNEMADTIEADVGELRHQEQARRELIANIAHDLATPLTAVQGFSEALADNIISDPAARQETALRIGREVQRLRRLVADMQHMTSLEAGYTHLDLAPLDMHTLVDETLAVIAPECELAGISIHNEINPSTPLVLADSDRITQVLLNLLDNARRHTPKGGMISVGSRQKEAHLHIWISDTGTGINSDDLSHIFERFYRADRSRTTATGGSGLGLAIVKAIIMAHHGTIRAGSTPAQGTRITFTLPLA